MPIANWPVDANECIRILFRVSDLLVYVSFVLFGQSFERYAGGALLYLPPITLDPQLGPSTGWPSTGFLIETFSLQDRPETVSGQYGPGAYASWLLVLLSSMVASFIPPLHTPDQDRVRVDADIIATNLYAIVASVDLLRRLYLIPFYFWGASFMAAERVVWNASIFSLAIIGPNRGKTLNARMRVQYIALWIFTLSQVLTKTTYFLNVGKALFGSQSGWNYLPELLRRLRDGATTTIPLVIYYRWSAAIPSKFVKLLAAVVFFFCFTYGRILITYYWLFLPLSVDDIATWRLRILLLPARSGLTELDQAAPLITAVLILLWQWKAWKLGLMAVRSAKNSVFRSRSTEEPEIDLEDIPAGTSQTAA